MASMKTIDQIHRDNLAALVMEYGSVTAVAGTIGISPSQYSQWLNGSENSGTGKPRGMRPASARKIEKACKKPSGWMDKEHPQEGLAAPSLASAPRREPRMVLAYDDEEALLDLYRRTDDNGRREILREARIQVAESIGGTVGSAHNKG